MNTEEKALQYLNRLSLPPASEPLRVHIFWFQSWNYSVTPPTVQQGFHRHSFFEAHFPLNGSVSYRFENQEQCRVAKGEYLLLAPNISHAVVESSEDYQKFSFGFSVEGAEENVLSSAACAALSSPKSLLAQQSEAMKECFRRVLKEAAAPTPFTPYRIRDLALGILYEMLRPMLPQADVAPSAHQTDRRVDRALRFVKDNARQAITVGQVASSVHLSAKQLCRIVQEHTGKPLYRLICDERLAVAKAYLLETDLSLQEISALLEYSNEYNFNRFFRRNEGMTPGAFRKSAGKY